MKNTSVLFVVEDIIRNMHKKVIIAGYSAADYWGFSPFTSKKIELMTDRNYNPNIKGTNIRVMRRIIENYQKDIQTIKWEGKQYQITSKESTFIEVYKSFKGNYNDQNLELCKMFFSSNYDKSKLYNLSKKNNILNEIKLLEIMYAKRRV